MRATSGGLVRCGHVALSVALLAACSHASAAPDPTVTGAATTIGSTVSSSTVPTTTLPPTTTTLPPTTLPPTTLPPTTTTMLVPGSEVLPDVIAAAALGAVPDGTPIGSAGGDQAVLYKNGCHVSWTATKPKEGCIYGDPNSDVTVVVTGDSHATAWFGAFDEAGKANHWKIVMVDKQGCPTADVTVHSAADKSHPYVVYTACNEWRLNAIAYINSLHPTLVVFPMLSRRAVVGHPGAAAIPAWGEGLGRTIDAVRVNGTKVLVIGDTPKTNGELIPSCVAAHRKNIAPCGNTRSAAVLTERLTMLAAAAAAHHAAYVDPSNWFCTDTFCPAVIGDSVVYRDNHHLTDRFSRYRAPQIADAIRFALAATV